MSFLPPVRFDPKALERPYAALDELAEELHLPATINSRGLLAARLVDLQALRLALSEGRLPEDDVAWPLAPAAAAFRSVMTDLEIPALARGNGAIAEQVLRSLLWHTDRIVDYSGSEAAAVHLAVAAFRADWRSQANDISELLATFDDIGALLKASNWALARGLLRSEAWQELVRIRGLLESLPELRTLIRQLGRARQTNETDLARPPQLQAMAEVRTRVPRRRSLQVPGLVAETRGVVRGPRVARMLPSEAVLLGLPKLRLVWFARFAEQSLLIYDDADRIEETVPSEAQGWRADPLPQPQRRLEAGPMVLCVDTSASMRGGAENVAKAVVLEAMRTAAAQGRRCYVYAFGGPEEVVERELPLDAKGLTAMLDFLGQGFHGGTDIGAPLERALGRIAGEEWRLADLLIASDGEFGATPELAARLADARAGLGLRVQGILIGDRETMGMAALCDHLFWVGDWRRFGSGHGVLPVDTRNLTARFFPNAVTRPPGRE